jgi:FtsZ-binding cell division protein ZapB
MGMIRKINLMGVPLQVEDLLFNIDRKKQRKRGCFACGEKGHFRDNCPTMAKPKKEKSNGKALTSVKTWDDSSNEDEPPRTRSHRSSSRSSRKCLMARGKMSIPSSSDESSSDDEGEGKPSVDELAEAIKFFQDVFTKQKAQLKTLKSKLISSQNDYKCLLENFETFANLNCELSTKIEHLETSAPSTAIDDVLIKKNEKLKAKLASSQEAIENLLGKMEILSTHNNELTNKLENIGSTPGAFLVEIPEIIKKYVSTSCFDLIDDSNPCNQVLVENIVVETCSDEVAKENEQLRQEVDRLSNALYDNKGKAKQIQHPHDNTTAGVNKPVEGETVICRLCHKEGHKSFQCKTVTGDKQRQKLKQNLQHLHQGGQKGCYTIFDQEEKERKCDSNQGQQARQQRKGGQTHLGAKGNNFNHEKHQEGLDPEREVSSPKDDGKFGDLANLGCISWDTSYQIKFIAKWISEYFGPKFPHP